MPTRNVQVGAEIPLSSVRQHGYELLVATNLIQDLERRQHIRSRGYSDRQTLFSREGSRHLNSFVTLPDQDSHSRHHRSVRTGVTSFESLNSCVAAQVRIGSVQAHPESRADPRFQITMPGPSKAHTKTTAERPDGFGGGIPKQVPL